MYSQVANANIPQIGVSDSPIPDSYKWWRLHGFSKRGRCTCRHVARGDVSLASMSGEVFDLIIAGLEAELARARVRNGYVAEDA
jgi:hypothetical protein